MAQVLFVLVALASLALAAVTTTGFELLDRAERFIWEEADFESWSDTMDSIDGIHSIISFLASISLVVWLSRYVDNIPPLGGGTPKRSPRRVIVYWLVPIVNIIFLPLILNDAARRQSPEGKGHRWLVLAWWLLFVFPLIALTWTFPIVLDFAGTDWLRNILVLGIIERVAFAAQALVTAALIRVMQSDEYEQVVRWSSRPPAGDALEVPAPAWPGDM